MRRRDTLVGLASLAVLPTGSADRPKAPARLKTYNPHDVRIFFNGIELTGFVSGAFITADR